jgi:hypothetical protein
LNDLREIPGIYVKDHFYNLLSSIRKRAKEDKIEPLLNWLEHKDKNPWVLHCLCPATSGMSKEDWFSTSMNTNIAEAQHYQAQREGTRMTLVSAIQKGLAVDKRFFEAKAAVRSVGVSVKYGNKSMTGRAKENITRKKASAKKKDKGKEKEVQQFDEDALLVCNDLAEIGADPELMNRYLALKIKRME